MVLEFCLIVVPVQLPDDKTECSKNNSCVPGYVSTHSNGRKLAARALSFCVVISLCCAHSPVKEAAFRLSLLVLILSYLRELKRKLTFFFQGRADGLNCIGWILDGCVLWWVSKQCESFFKTWSPWSSFTCIDEDLTWKMLLSLKLYYKLQWKIMRIRQWHFPSEQTAFTLKSEETSQGKYYLFTFPWECLHVLVFPGIQTGKCVNYNDSIKTCEVFAWCPVEDDYHVPKWELCLLTLWWPSWEEASSTQLVSATTNDVSLRITIGKS